MRKTVAKLVFLVLLLACACTYLFSQRSAMTHSPFSSAVPLQALSKAVADGQGSLYITGDARTTIYKTTVEGDLLFSIGSTAGTGGGLYIFNDMSVDEDGHIYAVRTLLGAYGIKARSEEIVRYTPDGQFDRVIYHVDYSSTDQLRRYRIGGLKAPQVHGSTLYFYKEELTKFTQFRIDVHAEGAPEAVFTHTLPAGKYVAGIDGYETGRIYYSTRSGEIYGVLANGSAQQVYPKAGGTAPHRSFPESMQLDPMGRLVFVDFYNRSITRLDPAQAKLESLAGKSGSGSTGGPLAFEATSFALMPDGELLIIDADQLIRRSADGQLTSLFTEVVRSKNVMWRAWLDWGLVLLALAGLAYAIKLLYWNLMKRRASIMIKQILIFTPVIALSMILIASTVSSNFTEKMQEETVSELALLARNGQNLIDGDELNRITSSMDYGGATYMAFRKKMDSLFEASIPNLNQTEGLFKAIYKVENGQIYRIMEDDDNIHMFMPFESTPQNQRVITEGTVETEQWADNGGEWIYAIAPIYDSTGKVVGIFETDKNMEGINAHKRAVQKQIFKDVAWITAGLLLIFLLMAYLVTASIRKLRKSVASIAEGNWDTAVKIRSRDEISDLGDSVNRMAAHIRAYIKNITDSNEAYYRFVPQQFMRILKRESMLDVQLGDQVEQDMSVLICNIRGFYRMSNGLKPEENFNFVNSFLKRFGPSVRDNSGMINKYLGAGFMALFPNSADDALRACLKMRQELLIYNSHRASSGYPPIEIGFGLHKGPLRLGIIGEEKRLEGNVISEGVNVAIELEKLTDVLGASILVTEEVVRSLSSKEGFAYRKLGAIKMENTSEPMLLYDVYEGDPDMTATLKHRTKAQFEQGITYYQVGRFYDAREAFLMVIKMNRQDKAAQLYFYACDEYFQNGTGSDWNGALSVS